MVSLTFAMLLNNYLTFWLDWPGIGNILSLAGIEAGEGELSVALQP